MDFYCLILLIQYIANTIPIIAARMVSPGDGTGAGVAIGLAMGDDDGDGVGDVAFTGEKGGIWTLAVFVPRPSPM